MYDSASTSGLTLLVGALAASVGLATLLLRWRNSIAKSQGKTPEQGRARFAASCVIEKGKAIGLGVECATCHTVYFIQQSTNRDRLYYCASQSPAEWSGAPPDNKPDFDKRQVVMNTVCFKLLCICGQQVSFRKTDAKWYSVPREALKRGHAVEGVTPLRGF